MSTPASRPRQPGRLDVARLEICQHDAEDDGRAQSSETSAFRQDEEHPAMATIAAKIMAMPGPWAPLRLDDEGVQPRGAGRRRRAFGVAQSR